MLKRKRWLISKSTQKLRLIEVQKIPFELQILKYLLRLMQSILTQTGNYLMTQKRFSLKLIESCLLIPKRLPLRLMPKHLSMLK